MNWGYKILFVYVAFVAGTMIMVFRASGEKDDLVTSDYYAQELKYQQKIDQSNHTAALSGEVHYEIREGKILIQFPKDFSGSQISGNLLLYCPSDEDKDIRKDFKVQDTVLVLDVPQKYKGLFELHLTWQANGSDYYFEKKIFI